MVGNLIGKRYGRGRKLDVYGNWRRVRRWIITPSWLGWAFRPVK